MFHFITHLKSHPEIVCSIQDPGWAYRTKIPGARGLSAPVQPGIRCVFYLLYNFPLSEIFYSFLMAASGLSRIALSAGKYPAAIPTRTANPSAANASQGGI